MGYIINPYMFGPVSGCSAAQGLSIVPVSGSTAVDDIPMDTWYNYNFYAGMILQSEIGSGEKLITGMQFELGTTISSLVTRSNVTVKLYHTTGTDLDNSYTKDVENELPNVTGLVKVLDAGNFTVQGSSNTYITCFTFEQNFCYYGVNNLVIQIEDQTGSAGTNYSGMWECSSPSGTRYTLAAREDGSWADTDPFAQLQRPNIKLLY